MSYRCSKARKDFESQIQLALKELAPLYKVARKSGSTSMLLGAFYVFSYSQLEVYVKTFIEDTVDAFNGAAPAYEKWPDLLLAYVFHKTGKLASDYRRFNVDEDEGAILKKLAQALRKVGAFSTGTGALDQADAADVLEKKKYPSPKNFPQLFRRIGVDIWPVIGRAGRMNGELVLTSLNDLRTDIAHEGKLPPSFSWSDFKDKLEQMRRFVAAIDRGVANQFCNRSMSRAQWNAAMT